MDSWASKLYIWGLEKESWRSLGLCLLPQLHMLPRWPRIDRDWLQETVKLNDQFRWNDNVGWLSQSNILIADMFVFFCYLMNYRILFGVKQTNSFCIVVYNSCFYGLNRVNFLLSNIVSRKNSASDCFLVLYSQFRINLAFSNDDFALYQEPILFLFKASMFFIALILWEDT